MMDIQTNVIDIFPTPVAFYDLNLNFSDEQVRFILEQEKIPNYDVYSSKENYVLDFPIMSDLKNLLHSCLLAFFKKVYEPDDRVTLDITQSWFNYGSKNQTHNKHFHQNSVISGILYINSDENDRLRLYSTWADSKLYNSGTALYPVNYNSWNCEYIDFPVPKSSFLVIPSHLIHEVNNIQTNTNRISLAVNTYYRGWLGKKEQLNEVYIGRQ